MEHADILRNLQYSLDFLTLVGPVAGALYVTFFVLGGGTEMTAAFGICLVVLTFGSCWACYRLGVEEERHRWVTMLRNRRNRRLEDEDNFTQ